MLPFERRPFGQRDILLQCILEYGQVFFHYSKVYQTLRV